MAEDSTIQANLETACCCWVELRLRWAHQTQKQQMADCFNKQSVPRFSCKDIHTGESPFAVRWSTRVTPGVDDRL